MSKASSSADPLVYNHSDDDNKAVEEDKVTTDDAPAGNEQWKALCELEELQEHVLEDADPAAAMPENPEEKPKYKTVYLKLQGQGRKAKTFWERLRSEWPCLNFRSPIKMGKM